MTDTLFAPLTDAERSQPTRATDPFAGAACVMPVPHDAPLPTFDHRDHGNASDRWEYRDASGTTIGYIVRFDTPTGKQILPRTLWRATDGALVWRWKQFPEPRPLINLHGLARRPEAPVLIVEGEKAGRAAHSRFPDFVATTSPGGSKAASKADWSPLTGRAVTIWPDADQPGAAFAADVAKLVLEAGASAVRVVDVSGLPDGWDVADPVPDGVDIHALLESAATWSGQADASGLMACEGPSVSWPANVIMTRDGLYVDKGEGEPRQLLAGRFEVTGEARDETNGAWSLSLAWQDRDGVAHDATIARADLIGDGVDCLRELAAGGLALATGRAALQSLKSALAGVRCEARERHVGRTGWHGGSFVLPGETIGKAHEPVVFHGKADAARYATAGTLHDWLEKVAAPCAGNPRLILSLSIAFAGPVFDLLEDEPGGVHLVGPSSCGKSSALVVAGSVWGGGGRGGFSQTWRATGNGLEGVAKAHSGTILVLDELGELEAREAGAVAYSLINGQGKARAGRDGSARARAEWRCLILSSGEIGLADKIEEAGRKAKQGQLVRFADVPADAGKGQGLFDDTHGDEPARFAERLKADALANYGAAGRAFLANVADALDTSRAFVVDQVDDALAGWAVSGADGQVSRVGRRFALIGASGELARVALSLPWAEGEAISAARTCFEAWRDQRGGDGAGEVPAAIEAIREAVERHGESRFVRLTEYGGRMNDSVIVRDALGFAFDEAGERVWAFTSTGWRDTLKGVADPKASAKALAEIGALVVTHSEAARHQLAKKIAGVRTRLYAVKASALNPEASE